jgi:hypothetical protein
MDKNIMLEVEERFNLNNPLRIGDFSDCNEIPYLFHYTCTDALKSIIANRRFWMSSCMFLNDSAEMTYTIKLLEELCEQRHDGDDLEELLQRYSATVEETSNLFVLSTSYKEDNLTLWYNYGNNDGYNIGLDYSVLANRVSTNSDYGVLIDGNKKVGSVSGAFLQDKVIYDRSTQENILGEVLNYYLKQNSLAATIEAKEVVLIRSIHNLLICSLFFKDPSFSPEVEFRFVLNVHNGLQEALKYRTSNGCIIPYCEFGIAVTSSEKLPITSITIGPRNKSDIAEAGLVNYLGYCGYDNIRIQKTKIPLRF